MEEGISFYRNEKDELCALLTDRHGLQHTLINLYPVSLYFDKEEDDTHLNVTFQYDFFDDE